MHILLQLESIPPLENSMEAVRFVSDKHLEEVQSWCRARGMKPLPEGWLSTVGFIVPGICCAWIYFTDSDICMIETLVSNPDSQASERSEAIHAVVGKLCKTAVEVGAKIIVASSRVDSVLEHAKSFGFTKIERPVYQIVKVL